MRLLRSSSNWEKGLQELRVDDFLTLVRRGQGAVEDFLRISSAFLRASGLPLGHPERLPSVDDVFRVFADQAAHLLALVRRHDLTLAIQSALRSDASSAVLACAAS